MKDMEKILEPFDLKLGRKKDLGTLLVHLKDNGVAIDEAIDYIKDLKKSIQTKRVEVDLLCPLCKSTMTVQAVNINSQTVTEDSSKLVYTCRKCMHQIFK